MNFEVFKEILKNNIAVKLGNEYDVVFKDVRKNNGVMLTGVSIIKKGTNMAPIIYINGYYDMYKNGRYTIYAIVSEIIKLYKETMAKNKINSTRFFLDFDTAEPYIIRKLINTEKNRELLEDVPHIDFLDLSIIFQVMLPDDIYFETITIHNEHCKIWEIGIDELIFAARRNMQRLLPNVCRNIEFFIEELTSKSDSKDYFVKDNNVSGILVLTNERHINGASAMIDRNFLRECSDKINDSFYILPSSVNELLAVPDNGHINTNELRDLVKTINDTEVDEEDVLSYSVYYFNMENDRLSVL